MPHNSLKWHFMSRRLMHLKIKGAAPHEAHANLVRAEMSKSKLKAAAKRASSCVKGLQPIEMQDGAILEVQVLLPATCSRRLPGSNAGPSAHLRGTCRFDTNSTRILVIRVL